MTAVCTESYKWLRSVPKVTNDCGLYRKLQMTAVCQNFPSSTHYCRGERQTVNQIVTFAHCSTNGRKKLIDRCDTKYAYMYIYICIYIFYFLWLCDPTRVTVSSFLRFLDHTQRRTTFGRTPLDEWSAHLRDLYLTTHNTHNRKTSMPPVGFEPVYIYIYTGCFTTCRHHNRRWFPRSLW
jgi:hypothetical protein